jgi:hypothetical protein
MEQEIKLSHLSLSKTTEALDCSRHFLYTLIRAGKLTPKYLGKKPYFSIVEIENAFSNQSNVAKKK